MPNSKEIIGNCPKDGNVIYRRAYSMLIIDDEAASVDCSKCKKRWKVKVVPKVEILGEV